jgi:hypothetical protein
VKDFRGDAIDAASAGRYADTPSFGVGAGVAGGAGGGIFVVGPGQLVGQVTDAMGAALPGASVVAAGGRESVSAVTDDSGRFVLSGVPSGPVTVTAQLQGFVTAKRSLLFDQRPRQVDFTLAVGALTETVTVTAEAPLVDTQSSQRQMAVRTDALDERTQPPKAQQANEPSLNVQSLQRRASGVLPVRMAVPRTGSSYRFYRTLVLNEGTTVAFKYKRR